MNEPTLAALADLYLLRCEVEGKSPRAVSAYRETVTRFLHSLPEEVVHAEQVQADHIYVYLGAYTEHSLETRRREPTEDPRHRQGGTGIIYLSHGEYADALPV
jgi:pyridoxine 5'-phosphate synthase PdxJ